LIWALYNAVVGIEGVGTWINPTFSRTEAFILMMILGIIIILISNFIILITYELICLIRRLYKENKKM